MSMIARLFLLFHFLLLLPFVAALGKSICLSFGFYRRRSAPDYWQGQTRAFVVCSTASVGVARCPNCPPSASLSCLPSRSASQRPPSCEFDSFCCCSWRYCCHSSFLCYYASSSWPSQKTLRLRLHAGVWTSLGHSLLLWMSCLLQYRFSFSNCGYYCRWYYFDAYGFVLSWTFVLKWIEGCWFQTRAGCGEPWRSKGRPIGKYFQGIGSETCFSHCSVDHRGPLMFSFQIISLKAAWSGPICNKCF